MYHRRVYSILIILLIFTLTFVAPAFAKISIVPTNLPGIESTTGDFAGTLVLTGPDGQIKIYESGDAVPEIVSQSTIEIFDGHISVALQEGDKATFSLLGNEFKAENETEVTLICGVNDCKIVVRKGLVSYTDETGQVGTVKAPDEFQVFLGKPLTAEPTAEGETTGFNLEPEVVPDSRNIESSPSS